MNKNRKRDDESKEQKKDSCDVKVENLRNNISTFMALNRISGTEMAELLDINDSTISNFLKKKVAPKNLEAYSALEFLTGCSIDRLLQRTLNIQGSYIARDVGINTLFYSVDGFNYDSLYYFLSAIESVLCIAKSYRITIKTIHSNNADDVNGNQELEVIDFQFREDYLVIVTRGGYNVSIRMDEYYIKPKSTRNNTRYVVSFNDYYEKYGMDYDLNISISYPLGADNHHKSFSFFKNGTLVVS